jgi:hypothetical protein
VKDSLWKGLDWLRAHGMTKFIREDGQHRNCALGVLDRVYANSGSYVKGSDYDQDVNRLVATAMELFPAERFEGWVPKGLGYGRGAYAVGEGFMGLVNYARLANFNNHPDTTQADLELVFEKAAIKSDEVLSG